jgi:hypothetical protein
VLFSALLIFLVVSGVNAQSVKSPNTITVGLTNLFFGGVASYERALNENFSIGVDTVGAFIFPTEAGVLLRGYYYPGGGNFFWDVGLGYGGGVTLLPPGAGAGLLISPGFGWKNDIGQPGAFIFQTSFNLDFAVPSSGFFAAFRFNLALGYTF